jgi:NhaA family Na+:H+ antiporter
MNFDRIRHFITEFIKLESSGGILLFFMTILALIVANSPWEHYYHEILHNVYFSLNLGQFSLSNSIHHWINDGLMVVFFLVVGLEIKREIVEGELNSFNKMVLPGVAALGGMIAPAMIYALINLGDGSAMRGWAIPTATDIAFALGILALLGPRVPVAVKIFLTALAILDDLGAILIIALFYTKNIHELSLIMAGVSFAVLVLMNRFGVTKFAPYIIVGLVLWYFVLQSGVHATIAGVLLAFTIPLRDKNNPQLSPLRKLEHDIHPWVAFFIVPLFAFANAGVSLAGISWDVLLHPIPLGIAAGLFVGKQIGVFGVSWLFIRLGMASMPSRTNLVHLYGVSILCGIGFTMSLFVGGLAYGTDPQFVVLVRVGVFIGSILSGVFGYLLLSMAGKRDATNQDSNL